MMDRSNDWQAAVDAACAVLPVVRERRMRVRQLCPSARTHKLLRTHVLVHRMHACAVAGRGKTRQIDTHHEAKARALAVCGCC
jgi:hypothetical protein